MLAETTFLKEEHRDRTEAGQAVSVSTQLSHDRCLTHRSCKTTCVYYSQPVAKHQGSCYVAVNSSHGRFRVCWRSPGEAVTVQCSRYGVLDPAQENTGRHNFHFMQTADNFF